MGDLSVVGDRRARCANVAAQTRQREASALIWCCPASTTVERSATLMQPALWQTARAAGAARPPQISTGTSVGPQRYASDSQDCRAAVREPLAAVLAPHNTNTAP